MKINKLQSEKQLTPLQRHTIASSLLIFSLYLVGSSEKSHIIWKIILLSSLASRKVGC